MSITDELREYVQSWRETPNLMDELDAGDIDGLLGDFIAIADHIDAEHQKACDDAWNNGYEADYLGIEKWLSEHPQAMEHHGLVRLPKDADGEVWHVGDFVAGEVNPRNPKAIERMLWYGPDSGWQLETDTIIYPCPDRPRHHHTPTVEDVLRQFAHVGIRIAAKHGIEAGEIDFYADEEAIVEFATKLRLAEGGEG